MVSQLIGLDLGKSRTGIARASTAARLAEPLTVVPTRELVPKLKKIIEEIEPRAIVVGLPRNLEGKDTDQTTWAREWVKQAESEISVPIYWQDEALTTKLAEKRAAKKITEIDAEAAAIILQDFLDEDAKGE